MIQEKKKIMKQQQICHFLLQNDQIKIYLEEEFDKQEMMIEQIMKVQSNTDEESFYIKTINNYFAIDLLLRKSINYMTETSVKSFTLLAKLASNDCLISNYKIYEHNQQELYILKLISTTTPTNKLILEMYFQTIQDIQLRKRIYSSRLFISTEFNLSPNKSNQSAFIIRRKFYASRNLKQEIINRYLIADEKVQIKPLFKQNQQISHFNNQSNNKKNNSQQKRDFLEINNDLINTLLNLYLSLGSFPSILIASNFYFVNYNTIEINLLSIMSYLFIREATNISSSYFIEIAPYLDANIFSRKPSQRIKTQLHIKSFVLILFQIVCQDVLQLFNLQDLPAFIDYQIASKLVKQNEERLLKYLNCSTIMKKVEQSSVLIGVDLNLFFRFVFLEQNFQRLSWQFLLNIFKSKKTVVEALLLSYNFRLDDTYSLTVPQGQTFYCYIPFLIWTLLSVSEKQFYINNGFNTIKLLPLIYFQLNIKQIISFQNFQEIIKHKKQFSLENQIHFRNLLRLLNQTVSLTNHLKKQIYQNHFQQNQNYLLSKDQENNLFYDRSFDSQEQRNLKILIEINQEKIDENKKENQKYCDEDQQQIEKLKIEKDYDSHEIFLQVDLKKIVDLQKFLTKTQVIQTEVVKKINKNEVSHSIWIMSDRINTVKEYLKNFSLKKLQANKKQQ